MKNKITCKNCTSRYLGCHGECADYQAFRKERDYILDLVNKSNEEYNKVMLHKESNYQRTLKRDSKRRNT